MQNVRSDESTAPGPSHPLAATPCVAARTADPENLTHESMDCATYREQRDAGDAGDELLAEMREHVAHCESCQSLPSDGFAATLAKGDHPDGVEEHAQELEAPTNRSAGSLLRLLDWAGSHAMRPQFAAAAVLLLILGSSLLLLRPSAGTGGPLSVRQRGTPRSEGAPPSSASAVASSAAASAATALPDGTVALSAARALREQSGCAGAGEPLRRVGFDFYGTPLGADALWEALQCFDAMRDQARAAEVLAALAATPSPYRERAQERLAAPSAANSATNAPSAAPRRKRRRR